MPAYTYSILGEEVTFQLSMNEMEEFEKFHSKDYKRVYKPLNIKYRPLGDGAKVDSCFRDRLIDIKKHAGSINHMTIPSIK